ncbi:ribonuclease H family protein [Paraburkholderia adhaesiva]|uniref:ribonuclease H family protein n=1 Tax=Paraburkholderia adhaesiva TaxID=2883244 RepID=UPI001F2F0E4A|nr:ribonuclease H [Paraburkholderia adhaesiva]
MSTDDEVLEQPLEETREENAAPDEAAPDEAAGHARARPSSPGLDAIAKGLVLYTDAGSNPNPGPTGWGVHGYLYADAVPTRGSGNPRWLLTRRGYVEKYDAAKRMGLTEVTPIHYVDGFGSVLASNGHAPTNNVGELMAAVRALEYAQAFDVARVIVRVDSEYVRRGMEEWIAAWKKNGWVKRGGEPLPNAELWKELEVAKTRLIERGVEVKFTWVKSHSHHLGNVLADKLATIGIALSAQGSAKNEIGSTAAQGYWKYDTGRHPMLANRCLYFNSVAQYQQAGVYWLGDHGKEDELLGKRVSDGAHTVARLREPDAAIELVRRYTTELAGGLDSIVIVRLDQLFSATTHRELLTWGTAALLRPSAWRLDLNCLDEEPGGHTHKPLSRECRPPRIAMRAIAAVSELMERLRLYEEHDASFTVTDLTEQLYETREKRGGKKEATGSTSESVTEKTMELRAEYGVGFAALTVPARYRAGNFVSTIPVTLTLGIDLINRNALKRLEKANPKVSLITWSESERSFRYATVVEADGDICISAGTYSNLRVIP